MSNALRTLAVAAMMAGLAPMAAQATVVPAAAATSLSMSFLSVAEGGKWNDGDLVGEFVKGVTVSNAALRLIPGGELALINTSELPITITFTDPTLFHLNALSLNYLAQFTVGISINHSAGQSLSSTDNGAGVKWSAVKLHRNCPAASPKCNADLLLDGANNWITSIEFTPLTTANGDVDIVGLNGLRFTQIDATGGNNGGGGGTVPEPAGYGLAALALLAAGLASRRRNAR